MKLHLLSHCLLRQTYPQFYLFLFICLGSLAHADDPDRSLSLAEAQAHAAASNPGLDGLRLRAEAFEARIRQVSALPDPKLQVSYFGESVQTRTGPQEAIYSISQTVPWLSRLKQRKAFASSEAAAVTLAYLQQRLTLHRDVANVYQEAAYLATAIASTRETLELFAEMEAVVEERVRGGAALNDLLRVNVESERNRDRLASLRQNLISQRARLAALLAMDPEALPKLAQLSVAESNTVTPDIGTLLLTLEANNPELQILRQQITSAEFRQSMARLERYPDFTIGINYIQTGDALTNTSGSGKDPWNVSLAVNIPLWGSKNTAATDEARAMRRSSEAQLRERTNALKADLRLALTRHTDAAQRIQRYQKTLIPLAEQSFENTQTAYVGGQLSVFELIDSERSLLDLKLIYWRAVADLYQAQANIQALLGHSE